QAPLNGIWEGSGNVICLDVLRSLARDSLGAQALRRELAEAARVHPAVAALVAALEPQLAQPAPAQARRLVEMLALALQALLMTQHSSAAAAAAFIATRIAREGGCAYGTLPPAADCAAIIERAWP